MNKISFCVLFLTTILCGQIFLFSNFPNDLCPSIPGFDPENDCVAINEKFHPGAHFWFQVMIKKYPQAHLDKMRFCASNTYEAGTGIVYFPEYTLKAMDEIFQVSYGVRVTQEMFDLFAEDEYLLLHEAMHVLSNDAKNYNRIDLGSVIGASLISCILFVKAVRDEIKVQTLAQGTACAIISAYLTMCAYSQFQEYRADDFANQNSDEKALRAGICWFKRLDTLMSFENILTPEIVQVISKIFQDPEHPLPYYRMIKAKKALGLRFNK